VGESLVSLRRLSPPRHNHSNSNASRLLANSHADRPMQDDRAKGAAAYSFFGEILSDDMLEGSLEVSPEGQTTASPLLACLTALTYHRMDWRLLLKKCHSRKISMTWLFPRAMSK
jgi:hypothetical protein